MPRAFLGSAFLWILLSTACEKDNRPIDTTSANGVNRSPPADSAESRGHSLVRVVNAVHNGRPVVAKIGPETLFGNIEPGTVSDYREVSTTLAAFSVGEPGAANGATLATSDRVLMDGNRYTVFLVAENMTSNSLLVVRDNLLPASGMARIRVMHAAPGAPALDVSVYGDSGKLFESVAFHHEAGFKDVSPRKVSLVFKAERQSKVLLRLDGVDLQAGTATTIVVTGASTLWGFTFRDEGLKATPKT
jgi:hypothetical protein